MAFDVFPDPNTAATLGKPPFKPVRGGRDHARVCETAAARRAGPDAARRARDVRAHRAVANQPTRPNLTPSVELAASDPALGGPSARLVDPAVSYSIKINIQILRRNEPDQRGDSYFSPPAVDNIHLLKVVIEIPHTRL